MGRLFGTDGVRGIADLELTPELAFKLGRASANVIRTEKQKKPVMLLGTDTRISRDMLSNAMTAGICSAGGSVVSAGIIPTPGIAFLTGMGGFDAGIVITASHNSYEYNGIKFFNGNGMKLSDELEDRIEALIFSDNDGMPVCTRTDTDAVMPDGSLQGIYEEFLCSTAETGLSGLKVILDCANGAASRIAPDVLKKLGVELTCLNNEPDGMNINERCGSTHIDILKSTVTPDTYDCAAALDGDADRLLMLDEKGNVIDGDQIMAIIALKLKKEGRLKKNTLVATVMSNLGLDIMAAKNSIVLVKTRVGDRYVLEEMQKNDYNLGGELSGHIILRDRNTTGDGIITAIQIMSLMRITGAKLSELAKEIEILPQVLLNARVDNIKKEMYYKDEIIYDKCMELENEMNGSGRVLIRPSGTEPLIRVMIEGRDLIYITEKARILVRLIEERMK